MPNDIFKPYNLMHSQGMISFEKDNKTIFGDLGIQISKDGKVWICIDNVAFLRFKPDINDFYKKHFSSLSKTEIKENIENE